MSEPLYKRLTHPTKPPLNLVSHDGGKTWEQATGEDGGAQFDLPGNLGTTSGPVPKPPLSADAAPALPPMGEGAPQQRRKSPADLAEEELNAMPTPDASLPPPKPSWMEAIGRSLGQGLTFNWGDEMGGVGASLAEGEIPRAAGRGIDAPLSGKTDADVAVEAERSANDAAREAHKGLYTAGEIVGGGLATLPLAALTPGASALLPYIGRDIGKRTLMAAGGALGGAAEGAIANAGQAEEGERGEAAAVGAGVGGALGGLAGMLPLDKLYGYFKNTADEARAMGVMASEQHLDDALEVGGREGVREFGAEVERQGLQEGRGPAMFKPAGKERYYDNAVAARAESGKQIEGIVDEIMSVPQPKAEEPNLTEGFTDTDLGPRNPRRLTDGPDPARQPYPHMGAVDDEVRTPAPRSAGDLPANAGEGVHTPPTSEWHYLDQKLRPERFGPRHGNQAPPPKQLPPPPDFDESGYPLSKNHVSDVNMNDVGEPPAPPRESFTQGPPSQRKSPIPEIEDAVLEAGPDPKRAVVVDLHPVSQSLRKAAAEIDSVIGTPEAQKLAENLTERADGFAGAFADYKTAWRTRVFLDKLSHDARGQKQGIAAEHLRKIAGDVQRSLEQAVAKHRPDLLEPLREANRRYSTSVDAEGYARKGFSKQKMADVSGMEVLMTALGPGQLARAWNRMGRSSQAAAARGAQDATPTMPAFLGYLGAQMAPEDLELEK